MNIQVAKTDSLDVVFSSIYIFTPIYAIPSM
jgi:hypothetical protein